MKIHVIYAYFYSELLKTFFLITLKLSEVASKLKEQKPLLGVGVKL